MRPLKAWPPLAAAGMLWLLSLPPSLSGCTPYELEGPPPGEPVQGRQALNGVPQDGYPSYAERLMLVAINRARSDPNNPALQTAGDGCPDPCPGPSTGRPDCYTQFPPQKPLMYSHDGSRAARFHCRNLNQMRYGLSHNSPCILRSDIGTTNCDGSEGCACASSAHTNDCNASWQGGTNPWVRCSYFGYTADGEVGAAGYSDGWAAVYGWVGECADYEGHRQILTAAGHDQIGCGYDSMPGGCWQGRYYFCNTADGGPATAILPAGVHRPESGGASTPFDFLVGYYSTAGAPQSVYLVLDGVCYPMSREIGGDTNATYKVTRTLGDTACHRYWFLARDGAGTRATWPEAGSWGVGVCTDYSTTAAPAGCESCVPGAACNSADGCRSGTIDCSSGSAVCANLSNLPDGTSCGTDRVCFQGSCVTCAAGASCTSTDGCQAGTISCSTGQPVCSGLAPRPDGTACPGGVCYQGSCNACSSGAACTSTDGCQAGTISCATGQPVCSGLAPRPDGTACPGGVCYQGSCNACSSGAACTSTDGCRAGTISCATGQPVCSGLAPRPDGTACPGGVCYQGSCNACPSGAACSSADGCQTGAISCATGQPVCSGLTDRPDGTICSGGVCFQGACNSCSAGTACTVADGCRSGTIGCSTGQPVCGDLSDVADGSPCGTDRVCHQGACVACAAGAACDSADGCRRGAVDCASGQPVCGGFVDRPDGTACGAGVCNAGVCTACPAGTACTSPNGCQAGTIDCGSGSAVCASLSDRPDGTACPGGVCRAGACVACTQGEACSTTDTCRAGTIDCASGTPTCANLADRPDGTACPGGACRGGTCVACTQGEACATADTCRAGTIDCASGTPTCANLADRPDGTACPGGVCRAGTCTACSQGEACSSADTCQTGTLDCASGSAVCADLTARPDGTACPGGVCRAGTCAACSQGEACSSGDGCRSGTIECGTGEPVCGNLVDKPEGTLCTGGVCHGGACVACTPGEACVSADGCRTGTVDCGAGQPTCGSLVDQPDGTPCAIGECRAGTCQPPPGADGGIVPAADGSVVTDASVATPPDGSAIASADAGSGVPPGTVGASCGCSSAPAEVGWWSLLLLGLAGARRLRRRRAGASR